MSRVFALGQERAQWLSGVFLQWRLHAHGAGLGTAAGHDDPALAAARLAAFHETFLLLAAVTALSIAAAWRMREAAVAPAAA